MEKEDAEQVAQVRACIFPFDEREPALMGGGSFGGHARAEEIEDVSKWVNVTRCAMVNQHDQRRQVFRPLRLL